MPVAPPEELADAAVDELVPWPHVTSAAREAAITGQLSTQMAVDVVGGQSSMHISGMRCRGEKVFPSSVEIPSVMPSVNSLSDA